MAAGYTSFALRHLGGASAIPGEIVPGNDTPLPGYLGRVGSVPLVVVPGYRSIQSYWLGGACGIEGAVIPPEPVGPGGGGVGGFGPRPEAKARKRRRNDDEEVALLVASAWIAIWPD